MCIPGVSALAIKGMLHGIMTMSDRKSSQGIQGHKIWLVLYVKQCYESMRGVCASYITTIHTHLLSISVVDSK